MAFAGSVPCIVTRGRSSPPRDPNFFSRDPRNSSLKDVGHVHLLFIHRLFKYSQFRIPGILFSDGGNRTPFVTSPRAV